MKTKLEIVLTTKGWHYDSDAPETTMQRFPMSKGEEAERVYNELLDCEKRGSMQHTSIQIVTFKEQENE